MAYSRNSEAVLLGVGDGGVDMVQHCNAPHPGLSGRDNQKLINKKGRRIETFGCLSRTRAG